MEPPAGRAPLEERLRRLPPGAELVKFELNELVVEVVGPKEPEAPDREDDGCPGSPRPEEGVYTAEELKKTFAHLIGEEVTLRQIYEVAEDIESKYRADGFFLTRVIVPRQRVRAGRVYVCILEGFIGDLELRMRDSVPGVEDAEPELPAVASLIRRYLQPVTLERPLRYTTLERALLLANSVPGVEATGFLRPSPGGDSGASQLIVTIARKAYDGFVTIDNYGDDFTGNVQTTAAASVNALTSLGERFTVVTAVDGLEEGFDENDKVVLLSGSVRPDADGLSVRGLVSYGDSDPGEALKDFDFDSKTLFASIGARYPFVLARNANLLELAGEIGFDFIDSRTDVFGGEKFSRDHLRVLHVTGAATFRDPLAGLVGLSLGARQGLPILDASRSEDDFLSRQDGHGVFTSLIGSLDRRQRLTEHMTLLAAVAGQYAFDALLSDEEFEAGGSRFGRGFDFGELSGDSGLGVTVELRRDISQLLEMLKLDLGIERPDLEVFGFGDYARVWNKSDLAEDDDLASVGIGVEARFFEQFSLVLQGAKPLLRDSERAGGDRSPQFLFLAAVTF